MKFYADDELIYEVPDFMLDVLAHYENRPEAELRFKHVVRRILEAHCVSFMKRFRKNWDEMPNKPEDDEDFVKTAMLSEGYMNYEEKMKKAGEKAREKAEKRKVENEAKKSERKEALRKEREEKGALS